MPLNGFSVKRMAARRQSTASSASYLRDGSVRGYNSSRAIDIVAISDNPALAVYLSGLFQQAGWTIARTRGCSDSISFLRINTAAVAICEETLPDGSWRDTAVALRSLPDAPALVVIGEDPAILQDVAGLGGFDALIRPLRESDVIWSVASAWHAWMKRGERDGSGGPPCSGG